MAHSAKATAYERLTANGGPLSRHAAAMGRLRLRRCWPDVTGAVSKLRHRDPPHRIRDAGWDRAEAPLRYLRARVRSAKGDAIWEKRWSVSGGSGVAVVARLDVAPTAWDLQPPALHTVNCSVVIDDEDDVKHRGRQRPPLPRALLPQPQPRLALLLVAE